MIDDQLPIKEDGASGRPAATDLLVVLTTVETSEQGDRLAALLVETRLAACVQLLPPMTSWYHWHGRLERAEERLLLIKTHREVYEKIEQTLRSHHPYQTPEILALPVIAGWQGYLDWLSNAIARG